MNDLRTRFRRLDRLEAPDLWNEVVDRVAELEAAPRRTVSLALTLFVAALLLAGLAGALAVGLLLDWLPRPEPLSVEPGNGMIVAHDGCGRIVGIEPETSVSRDLVTMESICDAELYMNADTAWSSDGRWMAYLVRPGCDACAGVPTAEAFEDAGPWIYDAATGGPRHLGPCPAAFCHGIDISPDGTLVAYIATSESQSTHTLIVSAVDGGDTRRLDLVGTPGAPVFSPDGARLGLPLVGGRSGIHVIGLAGAAEELPEPLLLHGPMQAHNLSWSPDGAWIAFDGVTGPGTSVISIVRADGTDARVLASGPNPDGPVYPTWSPDSASIAYVTTPSDGTRDTRMLALWTVGIAAGEATRLYQSDCCLADYAPQVWSPDGEWIALGVHPADPAAESGIFLISRDGSEVRRLGDFGLEPVWQAVPQVD